MVDVGDIIEYECGDMSPARILKMFSALIKSGEIRGLQGHYQRTARQLIDSGYLSPSGDILVDPTIAG